MANPSTVVDSLLSIGIFANLVKGGDLLLRKGQKEWLQDRFETFTLWLDEVRPVMWFGALCRPRPAAVWTTLIVLFLLVSPTITYGGALALLLDLWLNTGRNILSANKPVYMFLLIGLLVAVPVCVLLLWRACPRLVRWLVGTGHGGRFFGRLLILYPTSVVIFGFFYAISLFAKDIVVIRYTLALVWPSLLPVFVLNASGVTLVSLLVLLWCLRVGVAVLSGLCWRIVEYDKGVFPALLLIATVALGLYRVFLTGG